MEEDRSVPLSKIAWAVLWRMAAGAAIGGVLVALFAQSPVLRVLGAVAGAVLVQRRVLAIVLSIYRKPEGGYIRRGLPEPVRQLDLAMVAMRIGLRRFGHEEEDRPRVVATAVRAVKRAAVEAGRAGFGDRALEIISAREACAPPAWVQAAWVEVIAAAREGVSDGAATGPPTDH
jgi:hypothetical protein